MTLTGAPSPVPLVLDTNIVLDVFVFNDVAAQPVRDGLASGTLHWLATAPMRDELERVLGYPQIVPRLTFYGLLAADVLARFDQLAHVVAVPPKVHLTCRDPDDQKFMDLAAAHKALLLSKDRALLSMRKRLLTLGVVTQAAIKSAA